MPTLKLLVIGLPQSGKSEFIKSISDLPLVSIQKKIVSTEEMVDMDYGRVHLENNMIYLYAPVIDNRIEFLWKSLYEEMHGFILLVDVTHQDCVQDSLFLYKSLIEISNCPHITAFTKVDLRDETSPSIETSPFGSQNLVTSCICTRKSSVRNVIQMWSSSRSLKSNSI